MHFVLKHQNIYIYPSENYSEGREYISTCTVSALTILKYSTLYVIFLEDCLKLYTYFLHQHKYKSMVDPFILDSVIFETVPLLYSCC